MKILSQSKDHRINSKNFYVEMSFKEYLEFAPQILSNNKFQRKRVRTSKTIYSLLREDLINGCIMPPLVLAVTNFDWDKIFIILFPFKNVIDGFNSYMNRSELPIDRQDLLDNIRMLEKMSVESNSISSSPKTF